MTKADELWEKYLAPVLGESVLSQPFKDALNEYGEAVRAENAELRKDSERQWVGLTDDEVYNALPGFPIDYRLEFYRAIEAKLKEKNT